MIVIKNRKISRNFPPYIIAELSANHNGSLSKAKKTILEAKKNGADAIKIQTYTPDTMTIDCDKDDFIIKDGLWSGYKLYDLYKEAYTPYEWHKDLFDYAKEIDITIFSTPFDESAVELLENLNTPAYKIASFELCDLPLIKLIASKGKPILMSTGMASVDEISDAVITARSNGCKEILLFHCISSYPANTEDANLRNICFLKDEFGVEVGLSDHTKGNIAAIASIALGATAIEKHFIIDRLDKGHDSLFSIEPKELLELRNCTKKAWMGLGSEKLGRSRSELKNKIFRRSLYYVNSLRKGDKIKSNDIRRIRPGFGIKPKFENQIIGKILKRNVEKGDPVKWDTINQND